MREGTRNTGIRILATLKAATRELDRIKQFVKVRGIYIIKIMRKF
ncbi:MAG: hypothetical protein R3218_00525 [Christiangramia sp.]|nr:hypothetical protein [Christiangramia sp.]